MSWHDLPPDARGIPYDLWYEQQIDRIFAEARERYKQAMISRSILTNPQSENVAQTVSQDHDWIVEVSPYDE